jgi:hypothetical protein
VTLAARSASTAVPTYEENGTHENGLRDFAAGPEHHGRGLQEEERRHRASPELPGHRRGREGAPRRVPEARRRLRPDPEDYPAVFTGDAAKKVQAVEDPVWNGGQANLRAAHPTQTELLLLSATTDELKAGSPNCPVEYKYVAAQMKSGLTVYCFKFVEPGSKKGSPFDGLIFVNGHWALFSKPWRALK